LQFFASVIIGLIVPPKTLAGLEKSELANGQVILPVSAERGVGGGIDTGECAEVIGEV
jgi:hypothetical protein